MPKNSQLTQVVLLCLASCGAGISALASATRVNADTTSSRTSSCLTYRETGKTVCGAFLLYWEQHGGVIRLGRPLSNPLGETTLSGGRVVTQTVQYFDYAILRAPVSNPSISQITKLDASPDSFSQHYPKGELKPYIEQPPRLPDARDITIVQGAGSGHGPSITMRYATSTTIRDIQDFYAEVMQKNKWEYICFYYCDTPQNSNIPGVGFWWFADPTSAGQESGYSMELEIIWKSVDERAVTIRMYPDGPPTFPQLPYPSTPPPENPTPSENPTDNSSVQVGIPRTGATIETWLPWILVSVAMVTLGIVVLHNT
jgi:hypothetical protein